MEDENDDWEERKRIDAFEWLSGPVTDGDEAGYARYLATLSRESQPDDADD